MMRAHRGNCWPSLVWTLHPIRVGLEAFGASSASPTNLGDAHAPPQHHSEANPYSAAGAALHQRLDHPCRPLSETRDSTLGTMTTSQNLPDCHCLLLLHHRDRSLARPPSHYPNSPSPPTFITPTPSACRFPPTSQLHPSLFLLLLNSQVEERLCKSMIPESHSVLLSFFPVLSQKSSLPAVPGPNLSVFTAQPGPSLVATEPNREL